MTLIFAALGAVAIYVLGALFPIVRPVKTLYK